jgi:ribosomal protein S27AE
MAKEMTAQEERYWMHSLSGDPLIRDFLRSQGIYYHGGARNKALNQPICPKCERMAFHHKGGVACPTCGYMGTASTHKLRIHLRDGGYR